MLILKMILVYMIISFAWVGVEMLTVGKPMPSFRDDIIAIISSVIIVLCWWSE